MKNSTVAVCAVLVSTLCGDVLADTVAAVQPTPAWADVQASMPAAGGDALSTLLPASLAGSVGGAHTLLAPEASLWYYVEHVRAQQSGRAMPLVESSLKLFETTAGEVSPVPLPGAAWFLVMGLLGAAGVRLQGRGRGASEPAGAVPLPR